tara:strand:+ start:1132 stop:1473 length:342 start_codon:yes stop_codon:yes gene_type:complete
MAHEIERVMGWQANRTAQHCGDAGDSDVLIHQLPQVFAEVKRVERLNVQQAMDKASEQAAAAGKLPVLFHRKNRKQWLITLKLDQLPAFYEMMETAKSMREEAKENELKNGAT